MIRRALAVGVVVALAVGGIGTGTAHAAKGPKPTITGVGDLACSGSGKVKGFGYGSPPNFQATLVPKLTMSCVGGTGHPTVTIKKAKVRATMNYTGDCTPDGQWRFSIQWKGKGGFINPTSVTFSSSQVTPQGWNAPGPGGTATVGGSWAGTNTSSVSISGPVSTLESACGQTRPAKFVGFMSFSLFL